MRATFARLHGRLLSGGRRERGDMVGWVLIAVMSLIIIGGLWAFLGPELQNLLESAMAEACGGRC